MVPGDHGAGEALLTGRAAGRTAAGEAFEQRAARAEALAAQSGSAAELLRFAADLLRFQAGLAETLTSAHARQPLRGSLAGDAAVLTPRWQDFLKGLRRSAAPEVAKEANRRLAEDETARWEPVVRVWAAERGAEDFLARAFLRGYLETLRTLAVGVERARPEGYCPTCGGAPGVSLRRTAPESQAGHRYLVCSLCGGEWPMSRIRCPLCQEADPTKLPIYSSEQHPAARIEACDTCRHYLKSIDLTLDGRAIAEVDDLLSVVLDLWAREQGYERLEPGIAGV